jgi:hypothetical protein
MTDRTRDLDAPLSGPHEPRWNRRSGANRPNVSSTFVARAIYGLITVLAVLQTMELHPPEAWRGAVSIFGTTLAVALIEVYAEAIGELLGRRGRLARTDLAHFWEDASPVIVGAQGPTIILLLSALGLMDVETAIDVAQVVAFVTLFAYGWHIGENLGVSVFRRLLSGLALVAIGSILVVIKAAFH